MRRMGLIAAAVALLVVLSAAAAAAAVLSGTSGTDYMVGTAYNDTMYGYAGNDRMYGYAGADRMYGGPGDDFITVMGGRSKDYIDCGPGFDTVKKQSGSAGTSSYISARNCERTIF